MAIPACHASPAGIPGRVRRRRRYHDREPELHTNFSLSACGEYLGLVDPNGNVISQFAPQYPQQLGNISYGVNFNSTTLIAAGASAQTLIPTNNSLGTTWTVAHHSRPTGWINGTTGVGFGIQQPGFNVTYVQANESIPRLGHGRAGPHHSFAPDHRGEHQRPEHQLLGHRQRRKLSATIWPSPRRRSAWKSTIS